MRWFVALLLLSGCCSYSLTTEVPPEDLQISGTVLRAVFDQQVPFHRNLTYQAVSVEQVESVMGEDAMSTFQALQQEVNLPACALIDTYYGDILKCVIGVYKGSYNTALFDPAHYYKDFQTTYVLGFEKSQLIIYSNELYKEMEPSCTR